LPGRKQFRRYELAAELFDWQYVHVRHGWASSFLATSGSNEDSAVGWNVQGMEGSRRAPCAAAS
jgi:hypothetical protein